MTGARRVVAGASVVLVTCVTIIGVVRGSVEMTAAVVNALPVKIIAIFKKKLKLFMFL